MNKGDIGKLSKHTHKSATKYGYSGEKVEVNKMHVRGDSKTGDNLAELNLNLVTADETCASKFHLVSPSEIRHICISKVPLSFLNF